MFQVTKRPKNPPIQSNKAEPGSIKQQHVKIRSHFHSQFSQSIHTHTLSLTKIASHMIMIMIRSQKKKEEA